MRHITAEIPLGDNRRIRAALNSHAEIHDEYNIQHNIDHSRNNQEVERRPGIAQRSEESCQCIICRCNNQSGINNTHIACHIRQQLFRIIHQPQDRHICRGKALLSSLPQIQRKAGLTLLHNDASCHTASLRTTVTRESQTRCSVPLSQPVTKNIREPVLPIAARASTPMNCPATIESAML